MLNLNKLANCDCVEVGQKEADRLANLGVQFPSQYKSGPIFYKQKKVGSCSGWSGIIFSDKEFIASMVKEVIWYVN